MAVRLHVMAGLVPATGRGTVSEQVAGTSPAMTAMETSSDTFSTPRAGHHLPAISLNAILHHVAPPQHQL